MTSGQRNGFKLTSSSDKLPPIATKSLMFSRTLDKRNRKDRSLPSVCSSAPASLKSNSSRVYKYKLLPGNNCRVILGALRRRPWWHATSKSEDGNDCDSPRNSGQIPNFLWEMYRNGKRYSSRAYTHTILNHIQRNNCLVTKKGLYFCLRSYCAAENIDLATIIPKTFFLAPNSGSTNDDLEEFLLHCNNLTANNNASEDNSLESSSGAKCAAEQCIWILKPASKTNRGFGIKVVRGLQAVLDIVHRRTKATQQEVINAAADSEFESACSSSSSSSSAAATESATSVKNLTKAAGRIAAQDGWIAQAYIEHPLLVSGRKFDIRCYVLITCNSKTGMQAYFYRDAYVRTSSKKYTLNSLSDRETHLTNDAVQKYSKAYGKFESGNKLSFEEWQQTICKDYPSAPPNVVEGLIYPEIKRLTRLSVAAAAGEMARTDIHKSFELLGYDYMVDELYRPVLIEVNSNPCLEFACPLLEVLIAGLIESVVKTALDPICPPPLPEMRTRHCQEAIDQLASEESLFQVLYP